MASSKVVLLVVLLVIAVSRVRSRSLFKRRGVRNYSLLNFTVYISEPSTNGQWPQVHAGLNLWVKPSSSIHRGQSVLILYSRLPITRTLANSNLALTRTKIDFPWIFVIYSL